MFFDDKLRRPIRNVSGFSLTELAIVLAVAGVVLGGVWTVSGRAWEYAKLERSKEAVATTVDNVRSYYAGLAGVPEIASGGVGGMTDNLINSSTIPQYLVRNMAAVPKVADNPWGGTDLAGTFQVCSWVWGTAACSGTVAPPTPTSPFFGVTFTGLTLPHCISLVESVSGPNGPSGLMEVNINGTNISTLAGNHFVHPVSDTDARMNCAAVAAPATSSVIFIYRVSASAN